MKEIELKILDINRDEIIRKLDALGAQKVFEGSVDAAFFDTPTDQLAKRGQLLRLRHKGAHWELTFKENITKDQVKSADEYKVHVDNGLDCKTILQKLDLEQKRASWKHRLSYKLRDFVFEIDTFPDIPSFLEIEGPDLPSIQTMVEALGFRMDQTCPWSSEDVLAHYGKTSGST